MTEGTNKVEQKPYRRKVSITLDQSVVEAVRCLAEADDRNFSQYINRVLRQHIEWQRKKESGLTAHHDGKLFL